MATPRLIRLSPKQILVVFSALILGYGVFYLFYTSGLTRRAAANVIARLSSLHPEEVCRLDNSVFSGDSGVASYGSFLLVDNSTDLASKTELALKEAGFTTSSSHWYSKPGIQSLYANYHIETVDKDCHVTVPPTKELLYLYVSTGTH